jgi:hypothetical protein
LLTHLNFNGNQISSINLSNNTALLTFECSDNLLASLNLMANTALTSVKCYNNPPLVSLIGLNTTPNLTVIECFGTALSSLNIQNGNNTNLTSFAAGGVGYSSAPNLNCIQVDNPSYMDANWSAFKNASASFSTNCATPLSITCAADFSVCQDNVNGACSVKLIPYSTESFLLRQKRNLYRREYQWWWKLSRGGTGFIGFPKLSCCCQF